LVGRSHECDFPCGVEHLPACTRPKISGDHTREIHASISEILQQDISVYSVDGDRLRELRPTHIVTQVQCDVCAASLRDVEEAIADWSGLKPPRIVALNPQSLDDVFDDILRTAHALDRDSMGERIVDGMRTRIESVVVATGANKSKPRVAMIEWIEPVMVAGNWIPTLVELAGGLSAIGEAGKHSRWLTWEELAAADPDVIIVAPCGFQIADSQRDWHLLAGNRSWRSLRAVRAGRVFVADGNRYFNRPGPRLAESVEILAEIIHGLRFGHEGVGWRQCSD
jgi:iron complex transport system substrate-binding protein